MQHRTFIGHQEPAPKRLSPEKQALQKEKASCFMAVRFNDGNKWSKWSNEYAQPNKFLNISDAINEMFRIVADPKWRGRVASAAIFDTRAEKRIGAHNKIYQFEKGAWNMVNPFTW